MANVTLTVVFTREDKDTDWFWELGNDAQTTWRAYQKETYLDTGKLVSIVHTLSDNELQLTTKLKFKDKDTWDAFEADETVIARRTAQTSYENSNDISKSASNDG
jgi:hypothetical protein